MKGKIPDSILKRHKQAYRAPVHSSFAGDTAPEYVRELTGNAAVKAFGYFDPEKVDKLMARVNNQPDLSEVENMALAGILSTQLLHHLFIEDRVLVSADEKPANLTVFREQQ